jgi:hypothetical protein
VVKATATIPPKLFRAILPSIITITLADPEMPVFYTAVYSHRPHNDGPSRRLYAGESPDCIGGGGRRDAQLTMGFVVYDD